MTLLSAPWEEPCRQAPILSPAGDGPWSVQRFCPVFGAHLELLQICGVCISFHRPADLQPQVRAGRPTHQPAPWHGGCALAWLSALLWGAGLGWAGFRVPVWQFLDPGCSEDQPRTPWGGSRPVVTCLPTSLSLSHSGISVNIQDLAPSCAGFLFGESHWPPFE